MGYSSRWFGRIRHEHDGPAHRGRHPGDRRGHDVPGSRAAGRGHRHSRYHLPEAEPRTGAGDRADARARRSHRRAALYPARPERADLWHAFHAGPGAQAPGGARASGEGGSAGSDSRTPRGDRAVRGGVHPRHAQHDRLRGAGHPHAGGRGDPHGRLQDGPDADGRRSPSTCTPLRATARRACWRSSATAPMWSGRGIRLRNARCGTASRSCSGRRRARCWFRASPARYTASSRSSISPRSVGRKVGFVGRSMVDNVEIAHGMGRLRIPDGMVDAAAGPAVVRSEENGGAGERQPGRADVFAIARGRGQSPAASAWTRTTR